MDLVRIFCLFVLFQLSTGKIQYTISQNWDGTPLTPPSRPITGTLERHPEGLLWKISAPFYNDPAPNVTTVGSYGAIWQYEVSEIFFANDDNQYLQLLVGPHGHHASYLYKAERKKVVGGLPLKFTSRITGDSWAGQVVIPFSYFPPSVSKFNAALSHGRGVNRRHMQFAAIRATKPNYHDLKSFQLIDLTTEDPSFVSVVPSDVWLKALKQYNFSISKFFDGTPIPATTKPIDIKFENYISGLFVSFTAPFHRDPAPPTEAPKSLLGLWDYESFELYFANDKNQYIQITVGPYGHYSVLLFDGVHNMIRGGLELHTSSRSVGDVWTGEIYVPREYLPANTTTFNSHLVHGTNNRKYLSLFPAGGSKPNFHNLESFNAIDLTSMDDRLVHSTHSDVWKNALEQLRFKINRYWNGSAIEKPNVPLKISLERCSEGILVQISDKVYEDPVPNRSNKKPFLGLWNYQYVDVFLANEDGQYIQLQLNPYGHYTVILFNSRRNDVKQYLPLQYESHIYGHASVFGKRFYGEAIIPTEYLPTRVTKFNVGSSHTVAGKRKYMQLSITPNGKQPDFHNLPFFQAIDLSTLDSSLTISAPSSVWSSVLRQLEFHLNSNWDGTVLTPPSRPTRIFLESHPDGILFRAVGPFYNDAAPLADKTKPYHDIYKQEVTEVYFANDGGEYLQVQMGPYGHYYVMLFDGERFEFKNSLALNVSTQIVEQDKTWYGEALIPRSYLPAKVRTFNAAQMHGNGTERKYLMLYPADGTATQPDFHALRFFKQLNLAQIDPSLVFTEPSSLWTDTLRYTIKTFWNGQPITDSEKVRFIIRSHPEGLLVLGSSPFYNDPAPTEPNTKPFWDIWRHEGIEMYFANDVDSYLQIQIGPYGHYLVKLTAGERNTIDRTLPLNVTSKIYGTGKRWYTRVLIPTGYLPNKISKFNAAAVHGEGDKRKYLSLYPADASTPVPNFHALKFFKPINLIPVNPDTVFEKRSRIWEDALWTFFNKNTPRRF